MLPPACARFGLFGRYFGFDSLLLWILTQTRRLRGGKAAQDVPRTGTRQAEVCSFSSCYSLLQLCRLCGNRGNAWLEASFGGSDPPSLKSSPISRCREPAHAKFLVELAGAMAPWRAAARGTMLFGSRPMGSFLAQPAHGCCHCLGSAALYNKTQDTPPATIIRFKRTLA